MSSLTARLAVLKQNFSLSLELINWLSRLASELQGSSCLHLLPIFSIGVADVCLYAQLLNGC